MVSRFRLGQVLPLILAVAAPFSLGCDRPQPQSDPIPPPDGPLRPEAARGPIPDESRIADYEMSARLDADTHTVEGRSVLTWRNRTRRSTAQLPIHLYMNGFRAEDTAWMKTARGRHRGQTQDADEFAWGYIDVESVRLLGEGEPRPLEYGELDDPSLMRVELPEPVEPGQQVRIEFEFVTQLPKVFARTGFSEDFHMVAQWFPKVGVLEEQAGWKAHEFTVNDEFYADFGNYEVELDVPKDMVVGATGVRADDTVEGDRKKLKYRADMVHDFAWTAHPEFRQHHGEYDSIRIRQLIQPEHFADAPAHLEAQKIALRSFEDRYGPYPWSTITIVHAPEGAEGAGGMEYPTLYTTSDMLALPQLVRDHLFDERVSGLFTTIHEFGHQYFQGLLASDEHAQPWLDEGMNSMADYLAYIDAYGEDAWVVRLVGHELPIRSAIRLAVGRAPMLDPIDQPADAFLGEIGSYGGVVYSKTSAGMLTLRNLVGDELFKQALRTYADRWRFRHPTGEDLQAALLEVMGEKVPLAGMRDEQGVSSVELNLEAFMQQLLHDVSQADYRVHLVRNRRRMGAAGWHRDEGGKLVGGDPPKHLEQPLDELDDEDVEAVVVVSREGEFTLPVELLVEFVDGSRERVVWDGEERYRVFTWPGKRVAMASIDPESKILIEFDRLDNVAYAKRHQPEGGIDDVVGDLSESLALAVMGGFGP